VSAQEQTVLAELAQVFIDTLLASGEDGTGKVAILDGELATDCLGTVQVETPTALQLPAGAACPTAGLVRVMRADGTNGRIVFSSTGGVSFDLNGDGTTDEEVAHCNAAAQCPQ